MEKQGADRSFGCWVWATVLQKSTPESSCLQFNSSFFCFSFFLFFPSLSFFLFSLSLIFVFGSPLVAFYGEVFAFERKFEECIIHCERSHLDLFRRPEVAEETRRLSSMHLVGQQTTREFINELLSQHVSTNRGRTLASGKVDHQRWSRSIQVPLRTS